MEPVPENRYQHKIVTIPNLLSLFRILLVPVFCWTYLIVRIDASVDWLSAGVLVLSGLTDVADGFIARRFHMVSDVGKVLDPIADKFTQGAVLICLIVRFPVMLIAFVALALKEIVDGITGLTVIKKTGIVISAKWHGKVATMLLYAVMTLHVIWLEVPHWLTLTLTILCAVMLLLSMALYTIQNLRIVREYTKDPPEPDAENAPEKPDAPETEA